MKTLAERVKAACGAQILPAHLAKICKISRVAAGKWFTGETKTMSLKNTLHVADFCKVEPKWLGLGEGPMRGPASDPTARHLLELWPRLNDVTKGRILQLAEDQAHSPKEDGFPYSKSASHKR